MPNILPDLLQQRAVYWPPASPNKFGERGYGTPQEVIVRWSPRFEESIDAQGKTFISSASVYCETELKVSGWLWLSNYTVRDSSGLALIAAPAIPPDNQIIKNVSKTPDLDIEEIIFEAAI